MGTIPQDAKKLRHVTRLPFCRCLQRMRKFEIEGEPEEARAAFLAKAKKRYANLDRDDEDAVEDIEWDLGLGL